MRKRVISITSVCGIVFCGLLCAFTANGADKYWKGGSGSWDTTTANWATNSGGTANQLWSDGDNAIIEGAAGTITLAGPISIAHLKVNTNSIEITGGGLNFLPSGTITNLGNAVDIRCGISGSPDVHVNMVSSWSTGFGINGLELSPVSSNMILGTIYRPVDNYMEISGSATGNTIVAGPKGNNNAKLRWNGSGDWTVGDIYAGEFYMITGTVIANGELTCGFRRIELNSGATLYHNNAGTIGSANMFQFLGGRLDNTSGSPITTSTYNHNYYLYAGGMNFIGSQGANSDLNLGTGAVTMNGDRTITVSNTLTTLTVGGVIGDSGFGYDLTKDGAGTLALTGNSTYLGDTIINEGTLSVAQPYLSDVAAVRIANGATLHLDHAGTDDVLAIYTNGVEGALGTWGSLTNASAANKTALITGMGMLNIAAPTPLDGIRYWDGGTTNLLSVGNAISDGAGGTWSTTVKNWDAGAGVIHTNWNNATNDLAVFRGGGGTVNLGENISLGHILFDSDNYTVASNTLQFAPGGTISNTSAGNTISSGITGAPDLFYSRGDNQVFSLAPDAASMTLGTINRLTDDYVYLSGTATGNTVVAMPRGLDNRAKVRKYGTGTWTVNGELYGGYVRVLDGTLICNGRLWEQSWEIIINGGALFANGTMEGDLNFVAGTLGGTARVDCAVNVPAGSKLIPGYPTGTMSITSNACTIAGTLEINVDGSQHGALALDPGYALTISNATLNVNVGASTPATDLIIASYGSGMLYGRFVATNGIDTWAVEYDYAGGTAIALIPPASGTVLIIR